MKAIKLSKKQKEKLLEMVKHFFPEYSYNNKTDSGGINFHHHNGENGLPYDRLSEYLIGFKTTNDSDDYNNCDFCIHWFEFCVVQLRPKVLNTIYSDKPILVSADANIVDTLYKLWKPKPAKKWTGRVMKSNTVNGRLQFEIK